MESVYQHLTSRKTLHTSVQFEECSGADDINKFICVYAATFL